MSFICTELPVPDLPQLTHVGRFRREPTLSFDNHRHAGWEVHVVRRGRPEISMLPGRAPLYLSPDDVTVIPPGVPHHFMLQDHEAEIVWFGINPGGRAQPELSHMREPRLLGERPSLGPQPPREQSPDRVGELLTEIEYLMPREPLSIIRSDQTIGMLSDELVSIALEQRYYADLEILGRLIILVSRIRQGLDRDRHAQGTKPLVERAIAYVTTRSPRVPGLAETADALDVSAGHLSREFHRRIGVTYREWMNVRRLENANRLLAGGGRSDYTAACVGFTSTASFCRWYRTMTGHPPQTSTSASEYTQKRS